MAAPRSYSTAYLPNGATAAIPPGAAPLLPNQGRIIQTGPIRVLCIADVRGNLRSLNELAKQAKADHILHTGDFGFYDDTSLERIAEKTLKHVAQYSPLISETVKKAIQQPNSHSVKTRFPPNELPLSELPLLLRGDIRLEVPVYTVWGACEDVRVLEKFRSGEYKVNNLHVIDEARSLLLEIGVVKLRLLGLGGAVVMHKLFDNGEGRTTIAGGQGTMWTTLLQMGELIDTATRVYDPTETRVFITHASPAREGILNQLSVTLKADFSISAGLHFRYGSSYNEFSVNPTLDHYRGKLAASKASFNDVWETVKGEVEPAIQQNEAQQNLLKNALQVVEKMPSTAAGGNPFGGLVPAGLGQVDESAFKNMWNFNLADAAFGWLVLEIQDGRIGTEMRAQGFNFSHRGQKQQPGSAPHQAQTSSQPPAVTSGLAGDKATGPPAISAVVSTAAAPANVPANSPSAAPAPNPAPVSVSASAPASSSAVVAAASPTSHSSSGAGGLHRPSSNVPPPSHSGPSGGRPINSGPADAMITGGGARKDGGADKASLTGANGPPATNSDLRSDSRSSSGLKPPGPDTIGLFVMNAPTDELVREMFVEQDEKKITRIHKWGNLSKVVIFATEDDRDMAMTRLPADIKERKERNMEERSRPLVKIFEARETKSYSSRGGAGNWGSSSRVVSGSGPTGIGSGTQAAGQTGAYRAATGPGSDSETNRRGGQRGGGGHRGVGGGGGGGNGGNGVSSSNDSRRDRNRTRGPGGRSGFKDNGNGNGASSPNRTQSQTQAPSVVNTPVPQPADA